MARNGHIKTQAALNKEMLLDMYAQWSKSHPDVVAKYPAINPACGMRKIDQITTRIGKEILALNDRSEK